MNVHVYTYRLMPEFTYSMHAYTNIHLYIYVCMYMCIHIDLCLNVHTLEALPPRGGGSAECPKRTRGE